MQEFVDFVSHSREYEFAGPVSEWPNRQKLDPLAQRRAMYMAQGRTYTEASDLAVLAALHKKMVEGWAHYTGEIAAANRRIEVLEARLQGLLNSFINPDRPEAEEPAGKSADERLTPAQERKRHRAHQRAIAAEQQRLSRQFQAGPKKKSKFFVNGLPSDTLKEVSRAIKRVTKPVSKKKVPAKKKSRA